MPYVIKPKDDEFCIYKEGEDGEAMGETLGCHATEKAAKGQLAALYANESEVHQKHKGLKLLEYILKRIGDLFRRKGIAALVVNRATALGEAVMEAMATLGEDAYVIDVYLSGAQLLVLFNQEGKLYTVPVFEAEDGVIGMGDPTEVIIDAQSTGRMHISRQTDGRYRWFAMAASAVINKAGEIDSRNLFDDFVNRNQAGEGFTLRFFHDDRLELGVGDWLARSDNLLLASGLIHDNELGRAFIGNKSEWGTSIGFYADTAEILRTDEGIEIPVYRTGHLAEVSVLPVKDACSFFTRIVADIKERSMDTRTREALVTLFGDEAQADEFIAKVDETNRAITDGGLLTRETTTEEIVATTTEEATETPPETAIIPEQAIVPVDVKALKKQIEALQASLTAVVDRAMESGIKADNLITHMATKLEALETKLAEQQQAVDALKLTDDQKRQTWLADRPADSATQPVLYRPRTDRRSGEEGIKPSYADTAAGTLANMPKQNR